MRHVLCEMQRMGRNRYTLINRTYIESGRYRKKFDGISDSKELNRLIYQVAKQILNHRSGSLFEDMYWIDPDTVSIIAKETTDIRERNIVYSRKTRKAIKKYDNLVTIHSHPYSYPPSISDFISNYDHNYGVGIICCHNGKIFLYNARQRVNYLFYETAIAKYRKKGYDEFDSQILALEELKEHFDISFREVL